MKTGGIVFAAKIGSALLAFVMSVLIARALGTEGRAEYFLVVTLAAGVFAVFGLSQDQAISWAISERTSQVHRIMVAIRPLLIVLVALGIGAYVLAAFPLGVLGDVPRSAAIVGIALVPLMLLRLVVDAVLYASRQARAASVSLIAASTFQFVAVVVLWAIDRLDPIVVIVTSGLSTAVGLMACLGTLRMLMHDRDDRESVRSRDLARIGWANHPGLIALWLALRIDVFIVAALVSKEQLGIYTLAVTLGELVLLATDTVALTGLSHQVELPREASGRFGVELAADSARIAMLQVIGLAAVGWPLIRYGFGVEWTDAYPVLLVIGPGLVGYAYLRPLGLAFIRAGRSTERSIAFGVAAVANIAGTVTLVPLIGIGGGAVASTAGYLAAAAFLAVRTRRSLGHAPWAPSIIWPRLRALVRNS